MGRPIVNHGKLALGNLEIARDWGYAGDFVQTMWTMLQQEQPDNFVIGTGKLHTLRDLCETAYHCADKDWQENVVSDPALVRPLESGQTLADPSKAREQLGWEPTVSFDEMVKKMVTAQMLRLKKVHSI
jgi:GDPmannose 4,6-dehydratase